MGKPSFREQQLRLREDAILHSVNRLLAEKGFEAMTVDEVAADVGIAKASLYKHFPSKELLAAAAMVRILERAQAFIDNEAARPASAREHLEAVARWTVAVQLAGEMPSLPSQNSTLRTTLMQDPAYLERLDAVSERLGGWIVQAQADGALDADLPPEVVLYTLFARACDPVLGVLRAGGSYTPEQITALVIRTCFGGLDARADKPVSGR